jgi:hypothetical protein
MKPEEDKIREMLCQALPPTNPEMKQDLWPRMLRRLDERHVRMSWVDRILLLAVSAGVIAFPAVIPQLLYQL